MTEAGAAGVFTCPRCGVMSYNPNDVGQGYCGCCHDWTRVTIPGPVALGPEDVVALGQVLVSGSYEDGVTLMCSTVGHSWAPSVGDLLQALVLWLEHREAMHR